MKSRFSAKGSEDPKKTRISRLGLLVAGGLAVVLLLFPPSGAPPASADGGGAVRLLVRDLAVTANGPTSWHAGLSLVDEFTGKPQPTLHATMTATGPAGATVGPVPFQDLGEGKYEARFEGPPGQYTIALSVRPRPGGLGAIPLQKSFNLALSAGGEKTTAAAPAAAAQSAAAQQDEGGGGGSGGVVFGLVAPAVAAAAAVPFILTRRRRTVKAYG